MSTQIHPDQLYIDALLNNDIELINRLYERFAGKIKTMVIKNNGTEADAADIFQEALMSIYNRARNKGFVLTCPLEAFLYMVAKNTWLNELRRRKNSGVTFSDTEQYNITQDDFLLSDQLQQHQQRSKLLAQKLEELGEACRKLLKLSWSGKPMEEVAGLLNNSYGYVRKKKSECMAKLIGLVKASPQFTALKW